MNKKVFWNKNALLLTKNQIDTLSVPRDVKIHSASKNTQSWQFSCVNNEKALLRIDKECWLKSFLITFLLCRVCGINTKCTGEVSEGVINYVHCNKDEDTAWRTFPMKAF